MLRHTSAPQRLIIMPYLLLSLLTSIISARTFAFLLPHPQLNLGLLAILHVTNAPNSSTLYHLNCSTTYQFQVALHQHTTSSLTHRLLSTITQLPQTRPFWHRLWRNRRCRPTHPLLSSIRLAAAAHPNTDASTSVGNQTTVGLDASAAFCGEGAAGVCGGHGVEAGGY